MNSTCLESTGEGAVLQLSQATMVPVSFSDTHQLKALKTEKIKIKFRQEEDHGCDRKKLKMEKRIVDILYLVYKDPTQ